MDRLSLTCPLARTRGVDAAAGRMGHLRQSDNGLHPVSKPLPAERAALRPSQERIKEDHHDHRD